MKAANSVVVELDRIALFTADGDGRLDLFVNAAPVRSIQHAKSNLCHDGPRESLLTKRQTTFDRLLVLLPRLLNANSQNYLSLLIQPTCAYSTTLDGEQATTLKPQKNMAPIACLRLARTGEWAYPAALSTHDHRIGEVVVEAEF